MAMHRLEGAGVRPGTAGAWWGWGERESGGWERAKRWSGGRGELPGAHPQLSAAVREFCKPVPLFLGRLLTPEAAQILSPQLRVFRRQKGGPVGSGRHARRRQPGVGDDAKGRISERVKLRYRCYQLVPPLGKVV